MIKRCCFYLVMICSLQAKQLQVEVTAKSAILINGISGAVLFEKEAHLPSFPASITKVATALYVLEKQRDLSRKGIVTKESLKMKPAKRLSVDPPSYWLEPEGTKMDLKLGEELSLEVLLHGLMMISGNDAANVLAESVSGSIPSFVEEMNAYVSSLGCLKTRFCNPHGLHHPDHQTTAYDMALIAKRALQLPIFREIVSKPVYLKPQTNKQPPAEIRQTNRLVRSGPFFYPKAIGVKTGYTAAALSTLVAAAEEEGRVLIAVLLGCEKQTDRYLDAKKLFETAFAEPLVKRVLFTGTETYVRPIKEGKDSLQAGLIRECAIEYYPTEEPVLKAYLHWDLPALPICKGDRVGEMRLIDDRGQIFQTSPLVAKNEVQETFFFKLKKWTYQIIGRSVP